MAAKKRSQGLTEEERKAKKAEYMKAYQTRRKAGIAKRKPRGRAAAFESAPFTPSLNHASLRLGTHTIGLTLEPGGVVCIRIGKAE